MHKEPTEEVRERLLRPKGQTSEATRPAGSSRTGGHPGQGALHRQGPLLAHGHDRGGDQHPPSKRQFAAGRLIASFEPIAQNDPRALSGRRLSSGRSCPREQVSALGDRAATVANALR